MIERGLSLAARFAAAPDEDTRQRLRIDNQALLTTLAVDHHRDIADGLSSRDRLSRGQKWGLTVGLIAAAGCLIAAPRLLAITVNAVFLIFTLATLGLRGAVLALSLSSRGKTYAEGQALPSGDLPVVTILCPAYREAAIIGRLMSAISALDYPTRKLDVKLLLEEDDTDTIARALALRATMPFDLDVLVAPPAGPRTKPKACNHGLWSARGELLVIYDAEDQPEPDQLTKAAAAFAAAPDDVVCLQARLAYRGWSRNWLTRMFAIEYTLLFDLVLPGLSRLGAPLPLGGTSNIFRTRALREVGGWDAFNVTEDADLGMRLAHYGYGARMLDSTTYEVPMANASGWLRQRSRWIKGYIQCWFVHVRRRPRRDAWRHALTLHFVIGATCVAALLNPVFWTLYALWLFGPGVDLAWLFPEPLGALAVFALLLGNAFQAWLFMLAPLRRRWLALVPFALSVPIYWVMQSLAGYKAASQFVTKPFYWEKSDHHLPPDDDAALPPALAKASAR